MCCPIRTSWSSHSWSTNHEIAKSTPTMALSGWDLIWPGLYRGTPTLAAHRHAWDQLWLHTLNIPVDYAILLLSDNGEDTALHCLRDCPTYGLSNLKPVTLLKQQEFQTTGWLLTSSLQSLGHLFVHQLQRLQRAIIWYIAENHEDLRFSAHANYCE